MRSGIYVETQARNLKEYNGLNRGRKRHGYEVEAVFIGFMPSADGDKKRTYQDYIIGSTTTVGEPYNLYFSEE